MFIILLGVKLGSGSKKEKRKEGADKLSSLCIGKVLEADVVKEARNSKVLYLLHSRIS